MSESSATYTPVISLDGATEAAAPSARPARRTRATSDAQKAERRRRIMDAAAELAEHHGYAAIAMNDVAKRAGVAKGTLYLYFPTREALFLDLLRERLDSFFDGLRGRLGTAPVTDADTLASIITELLGRDPLLTPLLAILHTELEMNIDEARAVAFKRELREHVLRAGAALESSARWLPRGSGAATLLQAHALVIGFTHLANPAPVIQPLLEHPDLAVFRVDFADSFQPALSQLFKGLAAA